MSRTTAPEFAAALPVRSDDPYHRIQVLAEARAVRNGRDKEKAGRDAMALYKLTLALELDPNIEHILQTVAGEFQRA